MLVAPLASGYAGQFIGKIDFVQSGHGQTSDDVYVLVKPVGTPTGQPACATDDWGRFAVNPATPAGEALLALVLSAHAAGKTVEMFGTGNCSLLSGGKWEGLSYARVRAD